MPNKMPDLETANHATAKYTVGQVFEGTDSSGRYACWRYVQYLDAVTYIRGQVCNWANATGTAVTNDRSGGSSIDAVHTAGIACAVMTQNYYGFLRVVGDVLVIGDGSVAAGESVVSHTVDGQADTMAAGEEHYVFGTAYNADDTANDPLATSAMSLVHLIGLL
jgi:hypothetical protein